MALPLDALLAHAPRFPKRIACLTEETTEVLFRIGAGDLVVGVSSWTVRPPEALSLPRVSSFLDANFEKLTALKPDLVLGFSDLQADIARELARRGIPVMVFNQRSIAEVLQAVRIIGAIVGRHAEACALADELWSHVARVHAAAERLPRRPRVFFEEWPDPLISGIRWVSELVEVAGGEDICAESRARHDAQGRIFKVDDVSARDPELILASWCGKRVDASEIARRFAGTRAAQAGAIVEVESALILQPGPAALTDGLDALHAAIARVARGGSAPTTSGSAP